MRGKDNEGVIAVIHALRLLRVSDRADSYQRGVVRFESKAAASVE